MHQFLHGNSSMHRSKFKARFKIKKSLEAWFKKQQRFHRRIFKEERIKFKKFSLNISRSIFSSTRSKKKSTISSKNQTRIRRTTRQDLSFFFDFKNSHDKIFFPNNIRFFKRREDTKWIAAFFVKKSLQIVHSTFFLKLFCSILLVPSIFKRSKRDFFYNFSRRSQKWQFSYFSAQIFSKK
jgi:hypothetical protein